MGAGGPGGLDGTHFAWPGGDPDYWRHIFGAMANFWNSGDPCDNGTTPVGFYNGSQAIGGPDVRNAFGLYDVSGNVAELCWDRLGPYSAAMETDPHGPDAGDQRIVRGGSWYDEPDKLRLASRQPCIPTTRHLPWACAASAPPNGVTQEQATGAATLAILSLASRVKECDSRPASM